MVKRLGIILIITIGFLSSTTANSYYNNRNMPVVNMMLTMMDMMSRFMLGSRNSNFYRYPYSPATMGALPMSPVSPYGMGTTGFSPWSGLAGYAHDPSTAVDSVASGMTKDSFFSDSFFSDSKEKTLNASSNALENFSMEAMNGIWQATSGDIIAIYNSYYFIWTDGNRRHLAGNIAVKGKQMLAYIPANKRFLSFQFYREDDKFAVRDKKGQLYIFKKIH